MSYKDWSLKETCEMASKVWDSFYGLGQVVFSREKGEAALVEMKRRLIRRHQLRFFLSDLKSIGIDVDKLPPAVVCARYHYLTNAIGGIPMEYVEESPQKAWVRYWMGSDPTQIGYPIRMEKASMEGWHANNGELLHSIGVKNGLKVGVVLTKLVSSADPLWEMYFKEYDHDLYPDEQFQFIPEPNPPDSTHYGDAYIDMLKSGTGAEEYPEERVVKGKRAFWAYYVETLQEAFLDMYGTAPACEILDYCWRLEAVVKAREWKQVLGIAEEGAQGMALFMKALGDIQGEETEVEQVSPKEYVVRKRTSRMFRGRLDKVPPQLFVAQNGFYEASAECLRRPIRGPKTRVKFLKSMAEGDPYFEWLITEV